MAKEMNSSDILRELEPVVEQELNRHESMAKPWYPHDYVPWSDGKNFAYLGGEDWEMSQSKLRDKEAKAARAALYVNLLTEDNLPSYHREISNLFGRDSAWGTWVDRWTMEEGRHSIAMRDFIIVTRAIDPVDLEYARIQQVTRSYTSGDKSPLEATAYVTMQELATRIAHRRTGLECKKYGDDMADRLLGRIAMDENLHMLFYQNIGTAAFDIAPNAMMRAVTKEIATFQMPGSATIPEFWANAAVIADAGIYDMYQHTEKVVKPVLKQWNVWDRSDITGEGDRMRDRLDEIIKTKLEPLAQKALQNYESKKQSS